MRLLPEFLTFISSLKSMEQVEDGDIPDWLEYGRLHLNVLTFRPFSNLFRNTAVVFL